jgi:hypothetical protein
MRSAGGLLDRAIAAGAIRNDIDPEDLIRTLVGMCYTHDQPGWQKSVLRLVDIFIDGLRSRHAKRQTNTNKKTSPMSKMGQSCRSDARPAIAAR